MREEMRQLIARQQREDAKWAEECRKQEMESRQAEARKGSELLPHLKPAKAKHYKKWLAGYCDAGNKPTHYYDYALEDKAFRVGTGTIRKPWYVAIRDFTLFPLYGSQAVHVIVPCGINVTIEGMGHNSLYFIDGYKTRGHWVPVFTDTIV